MVDLPKRSLLAWVLLLSACAGPEPLLVSEWQLGAPGGGAPISVAISAHLDAHLPRERSLFELRTRVVLPESLRGGPLTLAVPQLRARTQLVVDDVPAAALDEDADAGYRGNGHPRWRIPETAAADGVLDLALKVEHAWTQSAWLDTAPRLSRTKSGDAFFRFIRQFNHVTAVAALATAVFSGVLFGIVFGLDRQRRAHGWFALEAFASCLYPSFQLGFLQELFGAYDAAIMATSLNLAVTASVHFTHAQFGLQRPGRMFDGLLVLCTLVACAAAGPFQMTTYVAPITVVSVVLNVGYQVLANIRLFRSTDRRLHALALTISWTALGLCGAVDFAAWLGLGELGGGLRGACVGIVCIAMFQSAVMSWDHLASLRRADVLNLELAGRIRLLEEKNVEVNLLNSELRRQISARSEGLAVALARAPSLPELSARTFEVGEVVDGRYRVIRPIGKGGMGMVYEVERVADRRHFALKLLSSASGAFEMARFAREAHLISEITHPNVVSIVDVEMASSGPFYIVMELATGDSLRVAAKKPRDLRWSLEVLRQLAEGLRAIHERGIVHRDLKPGNILASTTSTGALVVKIADFGISTLALNAEVSGAGVAQTLSTKTPTLETTVQILSAGDPTPRTRNDTLSQDISSDPLTRTGMILGTPRYMAPELALGARAAQPSSDIFGFGVIAYELLVGKHPFGEPPVLRRMRHASFEPATPIAAASINLSSEVARLVERCLSEDPTLRPSADELAKALPT